MNTQSILISIIIPTYNYASTLYRAISSVQTQMQDVHELIIVDDGSTDTTGLILEELNSQKNPRITCIRKENGGVSSARNLGITNSRGNYLIFLDADDALTPHALEHIQNHLNQNPYIGMIIGGYISVWPSGKQRVRLPSKLAKKPFTRLKNYLLDKNLNFCNGSCVIHRDIFSRGLYPETFRSGEDVPIFAQALANYSVSVLPAPLCLVYKHKDSLRHQFSHAKAGGLALVDEVFSENRLGKEFQILKLDYEVQRTLSLFRSAYLHEDFSSAAFFYKSAIRKNWKIVFKLAYTKKFIRIYLVKLRLLKSV